MDIVAIKVGENEPNTYAKFDRLSDHLDIIELLPRKRDQNGKLKERTMGNKADLHYLGLNIEMSHLNDDQHAELRARLTQRWTDKQTVIAKRLYYLDIERLVSLSQSTRNAIDEQKLLKRSKSEKFSMANINKFDVVLAFSAFTNAVVNKKTGTILAEELA